MKLTHASATDVGRRRKENEDSILVDADIGLYILSDGMGGHASGEVASKISVEFTRDFFVKNKSLTDDDIGKLYTFSENMPPPAKKLAYAIMAANAEVIAVAKKEPNLKGMGATIVAVLKGEKELYIGHVGDSRIYLLRDGALKQMTEDHSVYNEEKKRGKVALDILEKSPFRNRLVRAMGHMKEAKVDTQSNSPRKGDIFLLCSDGLTDMVKDGEIADIISSNDGDLSYACSSLVDKANENGGKDNISVLLIKVVEPI